MGQLIGSSGRRRRGAWDGNQLDYKKSHAAKKPHTCMCVCVFVRTCRMVQLSSTNVQKRIYLLLLLEDTIAISTSGFTTVDLWEHTKPASQLGANSLDAFHFPEFPLSSTASHLNILPNIFLRRNQSPLFCYWWCPSRCSKSRTRTY